MVNSAGNAFIPIALLAPIFIALSLWAPQGVVRPTTSSIAAGDARRSPITINGKSGSACSYSRFRVSTGMNAHLFAVAADGEHAFRYTIRNGALPQQADLTLSPVNLRSATDGVGNFYAQVEASTGNIDVFLPGKSHPSRTIEPNIAGAIAVAPNALAGDRSGYLYYAYNAQFKHVIRSGINVYAPSASGKATPVQSIVFGSDGNPPIEPGSLALGYSGDLFVLAERRNGAPVVIVYSHFLSHPAVVRQITGPGLSDPRGITVDRNGEIYVTNQEQNDIVVYGPTAQGRAKPERAMTVMCLERIVGHVVLLGDDAFAADFNGRTIYRFDKRIPGLQTPTGAVSTQGPPADLSIAPF